MSTANTASSANDDDETWGGLLRSSMKLRLEREIQWAVGHTGRLQETAITRSTRYRVTPHAYTCHNNGPVNSRGGLLTQ